LKQPQTNGKIVFKYVGDYGGHTTVYVNNEPIVTSFNMDKSILFLLWCVCDSSYADIEEVLESGFVYSPDILRNKFTKNIFSVVIESKYDLMYDKNALMQAYKWAIKKKLTVNRVMSLMTDFINFCKKKYKFDNLEIIYELSDDEIFENCRFQSPSAWNFPTRD